MHPVPPQTMTVLLSPNPLIFFWNASSQEEMLS